MTDERYLEWKTAIADARADGDVKKLASLQLDYNLELGECLAHQSQRTKDIKEDISGLRDSIGTMEEAVSTMDGKLTNMEGAIAKTGRSIDSLSDNVRELVAYRDGVVNKQKGAAMAWGFIKSVALGLAVVVGWAYAIYQAVLSYNGG